VSDRIRYHPYRLRFRQPLRTAHGSWPERRGWWVRRESADGTVGWGEIAPIPGFGGGDLRTVERALADLGETPSLPELAEVKRAGGVVAFGLGAAAWDWQAALPAGPDYLPVATLLPAGKAALERVESRLELGFRTFKWKVGVQDPRDEWGILDDLLARLPEGAKVRLDANGSWDRRTAERWLATGAERPMIEYFEQPTPADNVDLLMGLASDYPVTLALDEAVCGREDFVRWQDLGWPGVYVIKPVLWGDPADLLQTLRESDVDVVLSSGLETVVGARTLLALGFAVAGPQPRALGIGVWPLFTERGFEGPTAAPFIRQQEVSALSLGPVQAAMGIASGREEAES